MDKITYHRDNTVTLWNSLTQTWFRGDDPSDALLATLSREERVRVVAHLAGLTTQWSTVATRPYSPVTDHDGAAAGNIVDVERRRDDGRIVERRVARNGRHSATGTPHEITLEEAMGRS